MKRTVLAMLGALLLAVPLHAQSAGEPEALVMEAVNVTAAAESPPRATDAVMPGDLVEYRLHFTNLIDRPIRNVVFDNPLPAGMVYVAGSAAADHDGARIEFSIDGGASYSTQPTIVDVDENGEHVERAAPAEQYTNVRWTVTGEVDAGARVTASFRARLAEVAP